MNNIIWHNLPNTSLKIYYCSTPTYCLIKDYTGPGEGNISGDPKFVDPTNGDFRLRPDSPCIDAGQAITGLTQDFDAKPRGKSWFAAPLGDGSHTDIGAFEFQPGPFVLWIPGETAAAAAGRNLILARTLDQTQTGATISLELRKGSQVLTNFGRRTASGDVSKPERPAMTQVLLPATLAAGTDYVIRGRSTLNSALYTDTAPFAVIRLNGVNALAWSGYQ